MSRLQIPYDRVLMNPVDFDPNSFDGILKDFLAASRKSPIIMEVFNEQVQYLVFMREGQFYWIGGKTAEEFESITLRDFFTRLSHTQFPQIVVYATSLILYHSLLVYAQKDADLRISSTLVDLDDLLDRTEEEHSNALVTAQQPGNLVMLRYKDGKAIATYHCLSFKKAEHPDHREDFLVKVYTMSAHSPFEINLYTDLTVTYAEDARQIPDDYTGLISSLFLSQPPKLVVKLKNRPLKTYTFTGKHVTIGRLPDNDIVIDNLGVSRKHAVIHSWKNGYHVKDLGSKNSTFLNGEKIDNAELKGGDVITIGKYQIVFKVSSCEPGLSGAMDQTMIIPGFSLQAAKNIDGTGPSDRGSGIASPSDSSGVDSPVSDSDSPAHTTPKSDNSGNTDPPRLYRRSDQEEFPLGGEKTVIGKDRDSDIRLGGIFAPRIKVEITRSGDDYVIQKMEGRKEMNINGERMIEKVLEEEDLIAIGPEEFVFKR
ncbi:MAG: FHA domain-containing protein [Candidatus Krumholzibacteria bacterium]|nr:FHA domain-containing protein [Candidatus Krumholzibacteria bacterium]